jgi:hypothetical protein
LVSFRQVSLPNSYTTLYRPPYVPHAPPISFFSIWSKGQKLTHQNLNIKMQVFWDVRTNQQASYLVTLTSSSAQLTELQASKAQFMFCRNETLETLREACLCSPDIMRKFRHIISH